MLPSRPRFARRINIFGKIWTAHKSLESLGTSSKGQTPKLHTLGLVQKPEVDLDEHKRSITMFQQAT
jgi:hypothetical protein